MSGWAQVETSMFRLFVRRPGKSGSIAGSHPRPGITNGHFTFIISGSSGASVEIQASTNLQSWLPLATNTLVGGTNYFSDPQSANAKTRFYRALLLQ